MSDSAHPYSQSPLSDLSPMQGALDAANCPYAGQPLPTLPTGQGLGNSFCSLAVCPAPSDSRVLPGNGYPTLSRPRFAGPLSWFHVSDFSSGPPTSLSSTPSAPFLTSKF